MNQEVVSIQKENDDDLITNLPSEIMLNILLRLPARTVMNCKCVCKAWRELLETREFVKSHFSKSVSGLAVYLRGQDIKRYKIVEFVDEHRLNIVFSFDLPFIRVDYIVHSSANGLLLLCNRYDYPSICNPITREYIRLPSPRLATHDKHTHGFGVSKMSGEYKVVRMSVDANDCKVYTVGSGSWRRIECDDDVVEVEVEAGTFVNGNLHWLAVSSSSHLIYCLDLETERFSTFSRPPCGEGYSSLSVLGDYLCICYAFEEHRNKVSGIDIWLMKEYGDEKSWAKELRIFTDYNGCWDGTQRPIKVLKDGDILMEWRYYAPRKLLYYSSKSETIREVDVSGDDPNIDASYCHDHMTFTTVYTPSFLSLKAFTMENVSSF